MGQAMLLWPCLSSALKGAISEALAHKFILCPVPTELEADSVTSVYTSV